MRVILLLAIPFVLVGAYLYQDRPQSDLPNAQEVVSEDKIEVEELSISFSPTSVIQGEPVLIQVNGLATDSTSSPQAIESLTFNGKLIRTFIQEGKPSALVGIDLRARTGSYPVVATLGNGTKLSTSLQVDERVIAKAPLGIPDKLGGDTPEAERELINTLVQEGAIINSIPSSPEKFWEGPFRFPVAPPVIVTDVYGYSRITGSSNISHKGTDFRAMVGTPVYAMNSGLVRYTDFLRNYGHTVVIDHGLGVQTIYMHLSEILVEQGDMVKKGDPVAKSGATGYTLGAHLHLSLKIGGISIDPMRFMAILGE